MQTIHISTSHAHSHTQLPHTWTKHCPQCKDIRISEEEKEETKKEEEGEKKEKCANHAKSPNKP